jgi:hypothetical protein
MKLSRIAQQQALMQMACDIKANTRTDRHEKWKRIKSVFFLRKSVLTRLEGKQ